jgi:hypothetical protein
VHLHVYRSCYLCKSLYAGEDRAVANQSLPHPRFLLLLVLLLLLLLPVLNGTGATLADGDTDPIPQLLPVPELLVELLPVSVLPVPVLPVPELVGTGATLADGDGDVALVLCPIGASTTGLGEPPLLPPLLDVPSLVLGMGLSGGLRLALAGLCG